MVKVKQLELTIEVTRTDPETLGSVTEERNIEIPEQYFINQILSRYPSLQSVDTIEIVAGGWSVTTIE